MKVHTALGPGLLENVYEVCLKYELEKRGFKVIRQAEMSVVYDNVKMDLAYRLDLLVEDLIIIELKSVKDVLPIHKTQLLSYLKLSEKKLGLLINFNVNRLKDGITRIVNKL